MIIGESELIAAWRFVRLDGHGQRCRTLKLITYQFLGEGHTLWRSCSIPPTSALAEHTTGSNDYYYHALPSPEYNLLTRQHRTKKK